MTKTLIDTVMSTEPVKPTAVAPVSVSEETPLQESPRLPKIWDIRDLAWDFISRLFYFGKSDDRYAVPVPVFSPVRETVTAEAKSLESNARRFEFKEPAIIIVTRKKKSETVIVVATKEEIRTEAPKKDAKILAEVKNVNSPTVSPMAMLAETEEKKVAAKALLSRTDTNSALSLSIDPRSFPACSVQSANLFSSDSSDPVREMIRDTVAQMVGGLENHHELIADSIAEAPVFVVGPWFMVHGPWSVLPPTPPQILTKGGSVKIADFENGILETHTDADPMTSPKKFASDALSFSRNSDISFASPKKIADSGSEISNPLLSAQESVLLSESQVAFVGFPVSLSNNPVSMAPSHSSHRTEPLVLASTDSEPSQNGDQEKNNSGDQGRENPEQGDGEDEEFPT